MARPETESSDADETAREAGTLFLVATPIGNLEDITLRALRVLREVDLVLAEDTRRTRGLLSHHEIKANVRALHAHSDESVVRSYVSRLKKGESVAVVTDAGTPIISDPGARLTRFASEAGVRIESVPGASAVTAALCVAALRADTFRFVGFLPRSGPKRKRALVAMAEDTSATVLFESPRRVADTLRDLGAALGSRRVAVCRELTKLHEEVSRGEAAELAKQMVDARGEITIVVEAREEVAEELSESAIAERARALLASGESARDAARALAAWAGIPKKQAYKIVLAQPVS